MGHGGNTRLASSRKAFTHDQFAVESEPRTLGLAGSRRVTARTTIQPCDTSRTTGSQGNETNQSEVLETSLAVRPDDRRAASGPGRRSAADTAVLYLRAGAGPGRSPEPGNPPRTQHARGTRFHGTLLSPDRQGDLDPHR